MSFSVNDHLIDKKSTWSFDQWSLWHELNVELAEMIILLIEDENDDQVLHSKLLRLLQIKSIERLNQWTAEVIAHIWAVMTEHIIKLHYWSIRKWWKQRDSDSHRLIV